MRLRHVLTAAAVVVVCGSAHAAASRNADAACRSAMGPYYAALLSSARGDAEATVRHLLLFESRWNEVIRQAETAPWLRDTGAAPPIRAAVTAAIQTARRQLPRNVAAAHGHLESIRLLLRDARTRAGVRTVDDAVTDYHEAVERLSGHAGAAHEMRLTAADFAMIQRDVDAARDLWTQTRSFQALTKTLAGWDALDRTTADLLDTIARAARNRDGLEMQHAARRLKTCYFDLLSHLSRWTGE